MKRLLIAAFCLLGMASLAWTQEARFYLNRDTLSMDDELEVNGLIWGLSNPATPVFPAIEGFEKKNLRSRRERTDRGMETVFSQTYRPASDPGIYRLEAFEVRVNGDAYLFPGRKLTVLESELIRDSYLDEPVDAFLDFRLSQATCFVGEQVVAEALFYVHRDDVAKVRLNPEEVQALGQRINHPDFWEERVEQPGLFPLEQEVDGKAYLAYSLYKGFIFPLKAGEFPFTEVYADVEKRMVSKWATDYAVEVDKRIRFKPTVYRAAPRVLQVLPLPDPQITRAVGTFSIETRLEPEAVEAGERLELRVRISGDGNVPLLPAPEVSAQEGFRWDEPLSSYKVDKAGSLMHGSKEFVYSMTPAYAGDYELGPVVFVYFDPRQAIYDSLVVHSLALVVTGEDRPQVLQTNRLDAFYQLAFEHAGTTPRLRIPYIRWLAPGPAIMPLLLIPLYTWL